MDTKVVTTIAMLVAAAMLIAWDIYVAFGNKKTGDTISEITLNASRRVSVIPLWAGILCGHLFWPREIGLGGWATLVVLISITMIIAAAHESYHRLRGKVPAFMPIVYVLLGIPVGHFVWPQ